MAWILGIKSVAIGRRNRVVVSFTIVLTIVGAVVLTPGLRVVLALGPLGHVVLGEDKGIKEVTGVVGTVAVDKVRLVELGSLLACGDTLTGIEGTLEH